MSPALNLFLAKGRAKTIKEQTSNEDISYFMSSLKAVYTFFSSFLWTKIILRKTYFYHFVCEFFYMPMG